MPYSMNNVPHMIKDLPKAAQEIWTAAYNSALEEGQNEAECAAHAWYAVEKTGDEKAEGGNFHPSSFILHPLIEAQDKQGWEWEVVIIEAGVSGNGYYYSPEILREAGPLFDGIRALARADEQHLQDTDKSVRNIVGWFSDSRFKDNRIQARFHISEAADWLRVLMLDAWQRGKKDIVGFSIVAEGQARLERKNGRVIRLVEGIKSVQTVDVVVNPAAGGRIINPKLTTPNL